MRNTYSPHSQKIHAFAFPDATSREVFETWLSKMDHITPLFCESGTLADKKFDLIANGEGKYTLKIDKSITKPQLYNMIQSLEKDLGLTRFKTFEKVQNRVKMLVGVLLERGDMTEEELKNMIQKAGVVLGEGEFESLKNKKYSREDKIDLKNFLFRANKMFEELEAMSPEEFKTYVQSKKGHLNILKNKDTQAIIDMIFQAVLHGLDALFFARGKDELARNMMTITMGEIEEIERKVEKGEIGEEQIRMSTKKSISQIEKKLREDIGVDELKRKLEEVRSLGDTEQIEKIEIECANKILQCLRKYPWQMTDNDYGAFPNEMKMYKEIYCVGFAILGHIFLQELGIKHEGLDIPQHSALGVIIGNKKYYFDINIVFTGIVSMNFGKNIKFGINTSIYKKITPISRYFLNAFGYSGDVFNILCSQIYHNLGSSFFKKGGKNDLIKAQKYIFKAIELNPGKIGVWANLGTSYYIMGGTHNFKKAQNAYLKALLINPFDIHTWYNLGDIYIQEGGKNNLKKAKKCFKNVLKLNSNDIGAWDNLGLIYDAMGGEENKNKAKEYYKKVRSLKYQKTKEKKKLKQSPLTPQHHPL